MEFRTKRREDPLIEMAPLIDVVFLLLLFFMVTTQFISLPGLKLTLPGIDPGQTVTATDKLEVHITAAGDLYIDGNPVAEDRVGEELRKKVVDSESAVVVLLADENTAHGRVVSLMDKIRRNGFKRVVLAAKWNQVAAHKLD